jgi:hypothetical protein
MSGCLPDCSDLGLESLTCSNAGVSTSDNSFTRVSGRCKECTPPLCEIFHGIEGSDDDETRTIVENTAYARARRRQRCSARIAPPISGFVLPAHASVIPLAFFAIANSASLGF